MAALGRLGRVILAVLTGVSGFYLFYYLFRWEWVRAQIAGVAFVATLVIGAAVLILSRLDSLERGLRSGGHVVTPLVFPLTVDRGSGPQKDDREPRPRFPWLAEAMDPSRTNVFIPVLFAAGIVVSLVASLVERVATAVHGGHRADTASITDTAGRGVRRRRQGAVTQVVAAGAAIALAIAGIWWTAHYRPVDLGEGTTELTVQVAVMSRPLQPVETVTTMAKHCSANTGTGVRVERVEPLGRDTALLVVTPLLDEQMQRRYTGCLEDALLERHELHVTDSRLVPAPGNRVLPGRLESDDTV